MNDFKLHGGGTAGALIQSLDWSQHPLGASTQWSPELKIALNTILNCNNPMFLFWGPEAYCFYNDAYIPSFGTDRHPKAMGQTGKECWPEIWHVIGPQIEKVMNEGGSTWYENQRLPTLRNGRMEDVYWTYSYSPFFDAQGKVLATLVVCTETTESVKSLSLAEKSQERLQSIFSHAAVGFVVSTLNGQMLEVNPRFCEITGYSQEELVGHNITSLIHPGDLAQDEKTLKNLTSGQVSHLNVEKRFIKKTGETAWIRNSVSLVPGTTGEMLVIRVTEDVTSLREADRLRKESEERYSRLADSMPQIVWTANSKGELDYFNKVWFDYSGSTYSENVGQGWTQFVHPDDLPATAENWTVALKSGKVYENEFRLRKHTGEYRWHMARALPTVNANGEIILWYGTNTDIHDAKSIAQELQKAQSTVELEQQKFKTIFADSSTSMAVLKGADPVYEIANPSYLALFNDRKLIGRKFLDALPELEGQVFPHLLKEVFETGITYADREAAAYLKRSDSSEPEKRYFDQTYTRMLDKEGKPYGVFIHAIEVTDRVVARNELAESAERVRLALELANMGTWEYNPQTGKVNWSDRCRELFGVDSQLELELTHILTRIHPQDSARVTQAIEAALDPMGSGDYNIEYRILHKDSSIRWVSLLGKTFFEDSPSGRKAARFSGTVIDVTERVLSASALRDAKDKAESANRAKSSFLANMSHEIRTPLGAIMGFVSLLKDDGLSQQVIGEYASVIERNSVQLMRIIDDILDLSKVEAGMMQVEHVNFSLIELLSDFSSLMGFRAREKGILYEFQAMTELPDVINSDPTRIRQILTNIVGNALKFTDHGSVNLRVKYSDGVLEFEVQDTGRGISPEQGENLFKPFSQADISTTRKYGGTGLGLVLTQRLSEMLGGNFVLKSSQLGEGSVFVATIKVTLSPSTKIVKALGFASEPVRNAGRSDILSKLKVLLVEDSLDNQKLFSIYLGRAGCRMDIASDGEMGWKMAMESDYDVLLMDVQMPMMDGITAVKKLRSLGYKKPIIALTAHAMKEERQRCLDAGYTAFLSKPLQRQDLIDMLLKFV